MAPTTRSRYQALRDQKRSILRAAGLVQFTLVTTGFALALDQGKDLLSDAQFTWAERRILGLLGLTWVGSFALAGWIVGTLLRTVAEVLDTFADQAEASARVVELLEVHAVPTLGRIAQALESSTRPATMPSTPDPKLAAIDAARRAIDAGRWGQADRLVASFVRDHPGPDAAALLARLDDRRRQVIDDLRDQIEAAQARDDVAAVVDLRDSLTEHLRGDPLQTLDRDLVRWAVAAIRRRLRVGDPRDRVADLAARVVDSFGDMPETETLRAAFPGVG